MTKNPDQHEDDTKKRDPVVFQRRKRAAELVQEQRHTITSRIHSMLGEKSRRLTNTEDVLSTALRRIDYAVLRGKLKATTDAEFYAFVHGVIERTILEKMQLAARVRERERVAQQTQRHEKVPFLAGQKTLMREDLQRIGSVFTDPIDREIVLHKGRDIPFNVIAELMGMDPAAVRQRWFRMRARVRAMIEKDELDEECK